MTLYWWNKVPYVLKFYIICVGLCQDQCQQKCWKGMTNTQVIGATHVPNAKSENDCKDLCANNGTCVGIDWDSTNNGCFFQMTPTNNYYNYSGVNHWDLVNCSDDCLSYCWKPLKDNFAFYGAQDRGSMDENHCKLLCSQTTSCTGVDWITNENKCWLINFSGGSSATRNGFHHWDIVKNIPTNCQPNPAVTNPSYPPPPSPGSISTTSTTSTRRGSALNQSSMSTLSDVPSPTGKDATDVTGIIHNACETKDSGDSFKAAVIALAVLSGVFLMVIIILAVLLFRKERIQCGQSSSSNVKEPEHPYDNVQLDSRSPVPVYTELQSIN